MRRADVIHLSMIFALGGCTTLGGAVQDAPPGCPQEVRALTSPPGRQWLREQGWRYSTPGSAEAAYKDVVERASPWPDWFEPQRTVLPAGTRFQMAVGGDQSPSQPGAFGTFDNISSVEDVRSGLAVKREWKKQIDRVVTYEVVRPLPVQLGPVGLQVDGELCRILMGRWSQIQMLVPAAERVRYLKAIDVRRLH